MQWTDEGIVLGVRRHGEANAIAELMTREHGRHLGLVRGGGGSRLRPVLQPGNVVNATWRARLDEHLGTYSVEALQLRTAALAGAAAVYGITHVASLVRLLPERDAHLGVYVAIDHILCALDDAPAMAVRIVRFELQLLADLGFGLDLNECAATGSACDLIYVSPKSGRAVSRQAGEPWRDKLLPLPAFLVDPDEAPGATALADGFALTGYFLNRHVFEPRCAALAPERERFIAAVLHPSRTAPAA